VWPVLVGVEELRDIAEVVLPGGQSVDVVVIVFDVEAAFLAGPGEQALGVVLEVLVPGVLHHQTAAVVAVVALAELDDAVERVVLHGDDVAPVGQRQQVAVVVVAEVPRLVRLHASQLPVRVVRVILDVGVRVDAHALTRVDSRLGDLAALGVAELHAVHVHSLNVQFNLRKKVLLSG
jgi:hypothetical protein